MLCQSHRSCWIISRLLAFDKNSPPCSWSADVERDVDSWRRRRLAIAQEHKLCV